MATSYYATVRSDRDRELRSYEAQTDAWLKAKREGGMLPDFAGGMAASRQGGMMFGGSGSRDMQSYSMFRQWVYASVSFIAKRMAGQPWSAGELTNAERDGKKPPKKSHELSLRQPWLKHTVAKSLLRRNAPNQDLDVFQSHAILDTIDRPNPLQRRSEFMYMSVASLLLTGVCYWVGGKVKGKKSPNDKKAEGDKIELWAIPSHLVEPLHKDGLFSHYKIKMGVQDTSGQETPAANVARIYIPDPSDIMGVFSPLNACIRAIRTDDHVQGSQEGLFARGLMPHVGVVIGEAATQQFAPILTGPQRHQIERMIVELYNRTTNDGMPAIFDGMIKDIRRLDPMPREMDWKVSGEIVRDRILRAYGISLLLLGDTQGGNRAQAVMAEENAAANVFNPLADTFTETACDWLAPMFEAENTTNRIWAWMNPFVAHDEEMTSRQWDAARKNGDVDRNEYRAERLGLPPREDEIQKSALVETVGGVTGAIAVSQAVGQGVLEPEQAQTIFQQFFGLDAKVAKQLAGEKKPQPPAPGPGAPGQQPFGAPAEKPAAAPAEQPAEATAGLAPSKSIKYSEDQPRDEAGRFGSGVSEVATADDDDEDGEEESSEEEFTGTPNSLLEDVARPKLTDDEIREVKEYLAEGTPYYQVNESLRAGGRMIDKTLQNAINKAGVFSSPVKCYRGIEVEDIDSFAEEIGDVNGEYTDRGFVSTSTKHSFAGNVQMTIRVRHGLDASYYGDNQDEVLLPAGSTFKVLSKALNRGKLTVELEQVLDDDRSAKNASGKDIESCDIETPEGIPPPLSRKAIEKAHVARVSAREKEASESLAKFFRRSIETVASRVAKSGFKPDPSKDARKQAEAILKKAFDPKEHLKGLVRAIAPHLAASFCVGAGAELELTKQAAIRKKARGWTGEKYEPPEKEKP